jgi:hypothetical protein
MVPFSRLKMTFLQIFSEMHSIVTLTLPYLCFTDSNNSSHPFGQMEPQSHLAQIGISVEPLTELSQQTPATLTKTANVEPFVEFSKTMCENLFNYASSFTQTQAQMVPNPSEMFVPLSKLQQWYENFLRRLQQNPYFWRS